MNDAKLPKLLYIGDVPVENSYHGSALLYRLFANYPTEKLHILEVRNTSNIDRRLSGVAYRYLALPIQRWLNTRLHTWLSSLLALCGGNSTKQLAAVIEEFKPDAIITVAHGYSWQTAARAAKKYRLPLHLIVHDHWAVTFAGPAWLKVLLKSRFRKIYKNSASRLCVSPYMAIQYEKNYGGIKADVLYPSRAPWINSNEVVSQRTLEIGKPFTIGFAGTINGEGLISALRDIARALKQVEGKLLLYGPATEKNLSDAGLDEANIIVRGLFKPEALLPVCREEVDVLVVAVSFAAVDRAAMEINFPSKLTDYTAVGAPILIYGPETCSAVSWANESPGVAALVTKADCQELLSCIKRLMQDRQWRIDLTNKAMDQGERQFSSSVATRQLFTTIETKEAFGRSNYAANK